MPSPVRSCFWPCFLLLVLAAVAGGRSSAQEQAAAGSLTETAFSPEQVAFFEHEVKPILRANCIHCHGAEKKIQSNLDLTSREGLLRGGDGGPVVSLETPDESSLLQAINYESYEMPPKGKLPQAQIDVLARWVKMGLPWAKGDRGNLAHHGPPVVDDAARNFWAFRPVERPDVPAVKNVAWVKNPIDAFILAELEAKDLSPAPPADKAALVRRLYYTLTGLPPTPEQLDEALRALAPSAAEGESGSEGAREKAYAALLDKLLDSRHYGEHWGRHWLDLVRYAETNSFERDNPKPFVWRYRDYVIRSLNEDKPYDQFLREQLAGDELDEVTAETIIATGYYRLGLWDDEPADPLLAYYDGLDDILGTTGQTMLGLTVNCARCHDHKIDPFTQRDYYRLLSFFHGIRHYGVRSDESVAEASLRSIATEEQQEEHREQLAQHERQVIELKNRLTELEDAVFVKLQGGERDDFKFPGNRVAILKKHVGELISEELFDEYSRLRRRLERIERDRPKSAALALAVKEQPQPHETFVLLRGNPQSHGDRVEPGFPAVLRATDAAAPTIPSLPEDANSSGRRRVLADWIASKDNPLTSRVMVNRIWQYHFGRGIVRSSSDFGYQGSPPTHPELLDWLAGEFVASGWSLKYMHRLILTSNAFQMSSTRAASSSLQPPAPSPSGIDPENDVLSHFDLRRLTAEEVRDSILAVCGNLNLDKASGPSVYPPIPAEVLAGQSRPGYGWNTSNAKDAAARSVFVHIKRSLAVPILAAFDAPDPDFPCPVRFTTTQPTQALGMLNSEFLNEQAKIFADNTINQAGRDERAQVTFVLRRVLQRPPTKAEIDRGLRYLAAAQEQDNVTADEALRRFCLLSLNLNEFVYLE